MSGAEPVRVCAFDDLPTTPEEGGLRVEVGGRAVAVFRVGERVHALDDACAHRGRSLAAGELDGCVVACPGHGWEWDVRTGRMGVVPSVRQEVFEARVEDGEVLVVVPPSS